jgi:hypothetical protein
VKEIFFAFRLVKIPALERGCPRPSVVSIISRDTTPHAHAVEEEVHTSHSLSTSAESSVSESPARISASLELVPGQERTEAFQLALLNPLAHPHDAVAH